ncbi:hypothetical protein VULLAG_LOCUS5588 [Vulpes lagopus]
MSCQQRQQQCQPSAPEEPSTVLPSIYTSGCTGRWASGSGGGCGHRSSGSCCLSHHRSHQCGHYSSDSCDSGSGWQSGSSWCGLSSVGCC